MSTKLDLWKLIVGLCLAGAGFESVSAEAAILILQPDAIVGKDAQLVDDQPTTNLGGDVDLIANWSSNSRAIGLIQFDFSAIPAGATINSATLTLFQRYNDRS